ncbi:recombinase family protein [Amycolatopsis sp. NPDC051071]|uniref:recombinase family protein n=1 Tax=Amycolatopsis sp. NPDC051071 TaxID=3154637 RepID=UPI00342AD750
MTMTLPTALDQPVYTDWTADRTGVILAREYLRVSRDKSGEERSQEEQHEENQEAAADLGWSLGDPYRDTGSASEYAQKARGDFAQMVADLRADRFGAQILIIWESSRLSREVTGWVEMIDLCARRGMRIHVTSEEHTYDPANGHDRHKLIGAANDAMLESYKTSKRITRTRARERKEGCLHGAIPFGYRREYEQVEKRGKLVPKSVQIPHPDEAPIVRELFRRVLAGHSVRSIALDYEARGIRSHRGKVMGQAWLREMLLRPVYAGLRSISPEITGQWDGLVSPADFYDVQAIFAARTRKTPRPGAKNVRLLSTIARCDVCGGPMSAKPRNGTTMYSCGPHSCVAVPVLDLDAYVTGVVFDYLSAPGVVEELTAPPAAGGELARVLDEKRKAAADLDELERGVKAGQVSPFVATAAEEGIRERLSVAETREKALTMPNPLRPLFESLRAGDVHAAGDLRALIESNWDKAEISTKREALRVLLSPEMIGELRVKRSPVPRQRCAAEKRARFATTEEGDQAA